MSSYRATSALDVRSRGALKPGLRGLSQTLGLVTRAIREGARDPLTIDRARRIVRTVAPHDYRGETQAVWDYFLGLRGFPYRRDPVDVELVQGAPEMPVGGDCDCYTVQLGAHLEALGHPVETVTVGEQRPRQGQPPNFSHIYLYDTLSRMVVDPVLHRPVLGKPAALGDELPHAVERRDVPMPQVVRRTGRVSELDPKRVRGGVNVVRARRRRSSYGLDYGAQGPSGLGSVDGWFEDLAKNVGGFVAQFDPTNPKSTFGGVVRGAINTTVNLVAPGAGPAALAALDQAAAAKQAMTVRPAAVEVSTTTSSVAAAPKPDGTEVASKLSKSWSTGTKVLVGSAAVLGTGAVGLGIYKLATRKKRRAA